MGFACKYCGSEKQCKCAVKHKVIETAWILTSCKSAACLIYDSSFEEKQFRQVYIHFVHDHAAMLPQL